jgi:hypothetical protein
VVPPRSAGNGGGSGVVEVGVVDVGVVEVVAVVGAVAVGVVGDSGPW